MGERSVVGARRDWLGRRRRREAREAREAADRRAQEDAWMQLWALMHLSMRRAEDDSR